MKTSEQIAREIIQKTKGPIDIEKIIAHAIDCHEIEIRKDQDKITRLIIKSETNGKTKNNVYG